MTNQRLERILDGLEKLQLSPQDVELTRLVLLAHQACTHAEETGLKADWDLARELKDRAATRCKALWKAEQ